MADQVKIYQKVEEDVELRLKEAIDQLLGNNPVPKEAIDQLPVKKPVPGLDLDNVRFTEKLCPTNSQAQEIEFPNNLMMGQLKQASEDFWLAGVEYNGNFSERFNFIGSNGKRTE